MAASSTDGRFEHLCPLKCRWDPDRLLKVASEPVDVPECQGMRLVLTASIGIAMGDRGSAADLLRDADIALCRAKSAGKNRYVVFRSDMALVGHAAEE
jgi:GGDEF domain-containing protein